MKLLLLIVSVMTWTVQSKSSVTGSGDLPSGGEYAYTNTYNKGQVRKGDVATLTLGHMNGITVEKVSLAMRANTGSGKGTVSFSANGQTVTSREVTYEQVNDEVVVFDGQQDGVQDLVIQVTGEENSLYVDAFSITWSKVGAPAYTVTLMKGSRVYASLTEREGGAGVELPVLQDTAVWRFIGWSETEIWETNEMPPLERGKTRFFPSSDCTLWATYAYHETLPAQYMTDLQDGLCLYVDRNLNRALCGTPDNGIMGYTTPDVEDANQQYRIAFASPDTAYITHDLTATPIGHNGTRLVAEPSPWLVFRKDDHILFYTVVNNKTYILWLSCMDGAGEAMWAGLLRAELSDYPMSLQMVPIDGCDPLITCHPENPQDVENVESESRKSDCVLMRFGTYELHLVNGKKQLIVR
jgi:hypothetical protein